MEVVGVILLAMAVILALPIARSAVRFVRFTRWWSRHPGSTMDKVIELVRLHLGPNSTLSYMSSPGVPGSEICITSRSGGIRTYVCGHNGPNQYELSVCGQPIADFYYGDSCPGCLTRDIQEHWIRCGKCRGTIEPGDEVALYGQFSPGIDREVATILNGEAIGCMRENCCETREFFAGRWTDRGFVPDEVSEESA